MLAATLGTVPALASPASAAAGPVTISVQATPNPVATGQAVAYTVTVSNVGSGTASNVTMTDALNGVGTGQSTTPVMTSSVGNCTYSSPQVTCTAASLGAGQVWSVTITGAVTAAAGSTLSDTAAVSGSESSSTFSASATTTDKVSPSIAPGFAQTKLAGGLKKPIAIAFAPNGDIYIAEQAGTILIYRNGAILPTPVITLNVFNVGETGLLGIALDPNFATNGYLYASYTVPVTTSAGPNQPYAQLSRFTVVNGVASPASEKVLYRGNQVQLPDGSSGSYDHAGNDLKVGPDGKLCGALGTTYPQSAMGRR